ncbi:MAG: histone deacetylase family protein [Candidatus Lokiarchaeota archaeon]|nr:histone deacetylase family protein [Candidatus Lokiarchaeota archaeon]
MLRYVYSHKFDKGEYSGDPAADQGRFDSVGAMIEAGGDFVDPKPAKRADILLVHTESHYDEIASDEYLHEMSLLAAGGAIDAAELAWNGTPAFAAIRPPGHHASPGSAWGFCFFNNIAVALRKLISVGKISGAFILDFDLHFGDGTANTFSSASSVEYFHPDSLVSETFIADIEERFAGEKEHDILAVSAGFDRFVDDWGRLLRRSDYTAIGKLCKEFSDEKCKGRRFAVLEGGYNFPELGANIKAFCDGFA